MKRKWNKGTRNFGIDNYIYLVYDDYLNNVGYKGENITKIRKRTQKELDDSFLAQTGYSVKDYMKTFKDKMEGLRAINTLLNQSNLKDLATSQPTEEYKAMLSFLGSAEKVDFFKASAEVITEANILNAISRDTDTVRNIVEKYDKLTTFPMYDIIMSTLDKTSDSSKALAMKLALINDVLDKYNTVQKEGADLVGEFDYVSIENAEKAWQDIMNEISKKKPNISEINKNVTKIKKIINTVIKGANLGEELAKLSASGMVQELANQKIVDAINTGVEATGRKVGSTVTHYIPKMNVLEIDDSAFDEVVKSVSFLVTREEKLADVVINISQDGGVNRKIGISAKMYDPESKSGIALGSGSIGSLLAMGGKAMADRFFATKSAFARSFLNAMNFLLAQSDFSYVSPTKSWELKSKGTRRTIKEMDAVSGGTLTDLGMTLFSALLSAERIAFMNINGALVPTPTYYDYCMKLFTRDTKTIMSIGQIVSFGTTTAKGVEGSSSYAKKIKEEGSAKFIDKATRTSKKNAGELAKFGVLSASRNIAAKGLILNHRVSVSGYYIKPEDYKRMKF